MNDHASAGICPVDGRPVFYRGIGRPKRYCTLACRRKAEEGRARIPLLVANLPYWDGLAVHSGLGIGVRRRFRATADEIRAEITDLARMAGVPNPLEAP